MSALTEPRVPVRVTANVFGQRFKYRRKHLDFEDTPAMRELMQIGNIIELSSSVAQALMSAGAAEHARPPAPHKPKTSQQ